MWPTGISVPTVLRPGQPGRCPLVLPPVLPVPSPVGSVEAGSVLGFSQQLLAVDVETRAETPGVQDAGHSCGSRREDPTFLGGQPQGLGGRSPRAPCCPPAPLGLRAAALLPTPGARPLPSGWTAFPSALSVVAALAPTNGTVPCGSRHRAGAIPSAASSGARPLSLGVRILRFAVTT